MSPEKGETVKNTISFPKEIYDRVKKLAEGERRSINQQVVRLVEIALNTLENQVSEADSNDLQ